MSMSQPANGLQTTIWNNNVRSLALLTLYPFLIAGIAWAVVAAYGFYTGNALAFDSSNERVVVTWAAAFNYSHFILAQYWPMLVTVVLVWFIICYFMQNSMMRALSKSHPVSRAEEPALYNLLENLCIAAGQPMPRLEIVETHARNAFASGVAQGSYCITVTRGLMQSLSKDELEGVLAHELSHILNRDVRLMMVCVIFTGMFGFAAQLIWTNMRYALWLPQGRQRNGGYSGFLLLFAVGIILWLGYLATLFTRMAISRRREYMADAGAVQLTRNPEAMMRALMRISGMAQIPKIPNDVAMMCIENTQPFLGLFATHPPIEARIAAIASYSGLPMPDLRPKERASQDERFSRPDPLTPRKNWTTRQRLSIRRNKNPWGPRE